MQRVFVLSADGQALDPCHPSGPAACCENAMRRLHAAIRSPLFSKSAWRWRALCMRTRSRSILVQRLRAWPW